MLMYDVLCLRLQTGADKSSSVAKNRRHSDWPIKNQLFPVDLFQYAPQLLLNTFTCLLSSILTHSSDSCYVLLSVSIYCHECIIYFGFGRKLSDLLISCIVLQSPTALLLHTFLMMDTYSIAVITAQVSPDDLIKRL